MLPLFQSNTGAFLFDVGVEQIVCHAQGLGRDGYGTDAAGLESRGSEDTFNLKLKTIVNADYTELALAAGPLDIAGQVNPHTFAAYDAALSHVYL